MGVLAERLSHLHVRAALPDGGISGEFSSRDGVRIAFAPFVYNRVAKPELERRLAALARLLRIAQTREYYAAMSEAYGSTITKEPPAIRPRDQEYDRARAELVAEGRSTDGRVRITGRGMHAWTVEIADDALYALDEHMFAERVHEAAGELVHEQVAKIQALKARIYG